MQTVKNFKIGFLNVEAGIIREEDANIHLDPDYNDTTTTFVKFRDKLGVHRVKLPCGNSDSIYCFREGSITYFLTLNYKYGYCGLDAYDYEDAREEKRYKRYLLVTSPTLEGLFLQNPTEELCEGWDGLSPMQLCKLLADMIIYTQTLQ